MILYIIEFWPLQFATCNPKMWIHKCWCGIHCMHLLMVDAIWQKIYWFLSCDNDDFIQAFVQQSKYKEHLMGRSTWHGLDKNELCLQSTSEGDSHKIVQVFNHLTSSSSLKRVKWWGLKGKKDLGHALVQIWNSTRAYWRSTLLW